MGASAAASWVETVNGALRGDVTSGPARAAGRGDVTTGPELRAQSGQSRTQEWKQQPQQIHGLNMGNCQVSRAFSGAL